MFVSRLIYLSIKELGQKSHYGLRHKASDHYEQGTGLHITIWLKHWTTYHYMVKALDYISLYG